MVSLFRSFVGLLVSGGVAIQTGYMLMHSAYPSGFVLVMHDLMLLLLVAIFGLMIAEEVVRRNEESKPLPDSVSTPQPTTGVD